MGIVKVRTAIRVLNKFRKLRQQPLLSQKKFAAKKCVIGKPSSAVRT